MSLLLDDMRKEFATFLAADPAGRFRMDAALAHVVTIAYRRGLEDGALASQSPPADGPLADLPPGGFAKIIAGLRCDLHAWEKQQRGT